MNMVDIIAKKRDGWQLSEEEIQFFVTAAANETVPEYQLSALLMAIYFRGMNEREMVQLTVAMAHSGSMLDLTGVAGIKVDKHSTGGVADTATLVLAPLVASLGIPVVKMSGRGLGFSGGTIDKLESIPGFQTEIEEKTALQYANSSHIVLMGQSQGLTPADKKLYALRDVTATVESLPLIAASIMSKKIATGADAIVLDVKCGGGAFMKELPEAEKLAKMMISIGTGVGRKVVAVISSMDQPLGNYIGNALEVIEAIEVLKGNCKGALLEVSLTLGAQMLLLAQAATEETVARRMLLENIDNGKGLQKFRELIVQQHGDSRVIETYTLLPQAKETVSVRCKRDGYIISMDTALLGRASVASGAGRLSKEDKIDPGAGIILKKRIGDFAAAGEELAQVLSSSAEKAQCASALVETAIQIGEQKVLPKSSVLAIFS